MINLILTLIEIELAKLDYQIELNNYQCNQQEKPTKDFITRHHSFTDQVCVLKDLGQKIRQLEENL